MGRKTGPRHVRRNRKLACRARDRWYRDRWLRMGAVLMDAVRISRELAEKFRGMSLVIMPTCCTPTPVTFGLATAESRIPNPES